MGFTRRPLVLAVLFFAVCPGYRCAWAQKDAGSIAGTVRDPSGAVIADAKLTVTDLEHGQTFQTTTDSQGGYVASPLRVGRYTVSVVHGQSASQNDLDNWIKEWHTNYTQVLDPGNHNFAEFFDAEAMPWNANIDARTMEVLTAGTGAPADATGNIDIEGDVLPWVDFVNDPSTKLQ